MTARELADKKYGTKDLKDISEFNISLESAVNMMEEYKNRGKNLPIFSVVSRYFYNFVLTIWLLINILTVGMLYHLIYRNGFKKLGEHFEWILDRANT